MVAIRKDKVVDLQDVPYDEFLKNLMYNILRWLGENKEHVVLKRGNKKGKKIKKELYAILEVSPRKKKMIVGIEVKIFKYTIKFLPEAFDKFLIDKKYNKYDTSYILEKLDSIGIVVKNDDSFLTEFEIPFSNEKAKGYVLNFICSIPTYFFWRSKDY